MPSLVFSTLLGGSDRDWANGITVDTSGNVYVTGYTKSLDFDLLNEIEGFSGIEDVFVFKLEQTNNAPTLAYSTYLGGSDEERAYGITVDGTGNAYVTAQLGATPGTFDVIFSATDSSGNTGTATRVVIPQDTTPPVITINGANPINASVGQPYVDLGATALDNSDPPPIPITTTYQLGAAPGTFEVVYSATDFFGNTSTATRVIVVVP